MNYILIPGRNRPEFFYLTMEALVNNPEVKDYNILFAFENDVDSKYYDIIDTFASGLKYEVIRWPTRYGLTKGMLEGYRIAFERTDDYVILVEDDVLVSKDFLRFMAHCYDNYLPKNGDIVAIGASTNRELGRIDVVYKEQWYLTWGALMPKWFFEGYIAEHCNEQYYLNSREYADNFYKIESLGNEAEQANLILRVMIKNNFYQVLPEVPRALEIGFYGKHRHEQLKNYSYDLMSLQEKIVYIKKEVAGWID